MTVLVNNFKVFVPKFSEWAVWLAVLIFTLHSHVGKFIELEKDFFCSSLEQSAISL